MMNAISEQLEILQHAAKGGDIEYRRRDGHITGTVNLWGHLPHSDYDSFNFKDFVYRIREATPDHIDWNHVEQRFNYMARNDDGWTYLFNREPQYVPPNGAIRGQWVHDEQGEPYLRAPAIAFESYIQGTACAAQSLVARPD